MAKKQECCVNECKPGASAGAGGALYGLGFLGASIYYVTTAPDLWMALFGIVKAIFWPAILVYGLLKQFGL